MSAPRIQRVNVEPLEGDPRPRPNMAELPEPRENMKYMLVCTLLVAFSGCRGMPQERTPDIAIQQDETVQSSITRQDDGATETLPVQKDEAQAIAVRHLRRNGIVLSKHRLGAVRLVPSSMWMKGQHWIVTWELRTPSVGGQVFVLVDMDKQVKVMRGR